VVSELMELFQGFQSAYGVYHTKGVAVPGEKHKGIAKTVRGEVNEELWKAHLTGETPIGIITITEEGQCWWGAIDVDIYNLNHETMIKRIRTLKLPLIPCRSKSGGAHLFLFVSEPVPGGVMQDKLHELAGALGLAGQEIFPKQRTWHAGEDDLGSWMNVPYPGKKSVRHAYITASLKPLTLRQFIDVAKRCRITPEKLASLHPKKLVKRKAVKRKANGIKADVADFSDGPVCFQTITSQGSIFKGQRNTSMLNIGVYAKKRWPESWEVEIMRMNDEYMDPPRTAAEMTATIKNLRKKDYFYNCREFLLCSYGLEALCIRAVPSGRLFIADSFPSIDSIHCSRG